MNVDNYWVQDHSRSQWKWHHSIDHTRLHIHIIQ